MTNEEFRWWLRGFFELEEKPLTRRMVQIIENHMNLAREVSGGLDETNHAIERVLNGIRLALEADQATEIAQLQAQLKRLVV